MLRHPLRRGLVTSLTALLVVPVVVVMTLGTGAFLAAVGDATAAAVCRWVALAFGIVWGGSLVLTAALSAIIALDDRGRDGRRLRSARRLERAGTEADRPG